MHPAGDVTSGPAAAVVMPTFNQRGLLPTVIEPLLRDPAVAELVLVVDGCRDGSFEWACARARTDERLIPVYVENRGEMGARQAGLERVRSDVVVFLDHDVIAGPGLVAGHALRHRSGESQLVVGYMPTTLPERPRAGAFASVLYADEYERHCAEYERRPAAILHRLWAGNLSLRTEDALRIGMRDPRFGERYHPDRNFGLRCLAAGLTARFDRSLWGLHLHRRSRRAFVADARSQGAARLLLHTLHFDVLGPLERDAFAEGLSPAQRALVLACRRPRAHRPVAAGLGAALRGAEAAAALPAALAAAKALRRVEQQRGALDTPRAGRHAAPAG